MSKRKRDDDPGASNDEEPPKGARQQRVQYKITQGTVKLGHAFKVAKGFERQKLGRRQKTAATQKNEKDVQRIETEIAALKTLDTSKAAQHYLFKTLSKIKAVTTSEVLGPEIKTLPNIPSEPASLNVNARLCNSNPVKDALPEVLAEIQRSAGIAVQDTGSTKKRRLRAKDFEEEQTKGVKQQKQKPTVENIRPIVGHDADADVESEDEFAGFDDRLASSGDESDEGDGSDIDIGDLERQLALEGYERKPSKKTNGSYDHAADLSLSESGSRSPSMSPEPQKASRIKASTLIPSLSMGGYISGSGSDIDDEIDVAPKKNRRGQRARQAIWEKKFGTGAKHVQNAPKDRDKGWDPKRGATDGAGRGRGGTRGMGGGGRGGMRTGGGDGRGNVAVKKVHNDSEGPLHPSWEAAKKAKEKGGAIPAFQGTKVTFD